MHELVLFYGLLSIPVIAGVAYSLYIYDMHRHKQNINIPT